MKAISLFTVLTALLVFNSPALAQRGGGGTRGSSEPRGASGGTRSSDYSTHGSSSSGSSSSGSDYGSSSSSDYGSSSGGYSSCDDCSYGGGGGGMSSEERQAARAARKKARAERKAAIAYLPYVKDECAKTVRKLAAGQSVVLYHSREKALILADDSTKASINLNGETKIVCSNLLSENPGLSFIVGEKVAYLPDADQGVVTSVDAAAKTACVKFQSRPNYNDCGNAFILLEKVK